jgi:hypothetical protein
MKAYLNCAFALILLLIVGCKSPGVTDPVTTPNYSGQYQTVPYESIDDEPTVLLLLANQSDAVNGTGSWNGITFNFTGTVVDKHVLFTFDLKGTNLNDLSGSIDAFVGTDQSLAGGYKLWNSGNIIVGPIRFKYATAK